MREILTYCLLLLIDDAEDLKLEKEVEKLNIPALNCQYCARQFKSLLWKNKHKCTFCHDCKIVFSNHTRLAGHKCPASKFTFRPVESNWQKEKCAALNVCLDHVNRYDFVNKELNAPCKFTAVQGDGNCFFRSIAYVLTGTEENHGFMRALIVSHMRLIKDKIEAFCLGRERTLDAYFRQSQMEQNTQWATEVEIFATSHLLATEIYVYTLSGHNQWKWLKYSAVSFDSLLTMHNRAIYINHKNSNHYEPVQDVQNQSILSEMENDFILSMPQSNSSAPKGMDWKSHEEEFPSLKHAAILSGTKKRKRKRSCAFKSRKERDVKRSLRVDEIKSNQKNEDIGHKSTENLGLSVGIGEDRIHEHVTDKTEKVEEKNIARAKSLFKEKINDGPNYICISCHKLLYNENVDIVVEENFEKAKEKGIWKKLCESKRCSIDGCEYVCKTCSTHLKKGNIPAQSILNNLSLQDIPEELQDLNDLEVRLIGQRIPFMKIVSLPAGGQKGIHGAAVNVLSSLEQVTDLLPRLPSEANIVSMKLKRKLAFKGHYMKDFIRPDKVMTALKWLCKNNPLYSTVKINKNWIDIWASEQKDFWNAATNSVEEMDVDNENDATVTTVEKTKEHMSKVAKNNLLTFVDIEFDEDCLFTAFSIVLKAAGFQMQEPRNLRTQVVREMEEDLQSGTYMKLFSTAKNDLCTWNDYLHDLKTGSYGDKVTVQALANIFCVKIKVLRISSEIIYVKPGEESHCTVNIGLIGDKYYVPLLMDKNSLNRQDDEAEDGPGDNEIEGIHYQTCLQKENFELDGSENFSVAPAQGQKPRGIIDDPFFEELTFANLYPYGARGKGCYQQERPVRLSLRKYFQNRLLSADGRFAKNIEYLLYSQYIVEQKDVFDKVSIAMRKCKGGTFEGKRISAGLVRDAEAMRKVIKSDKAFKVLKQIRGSPMYWSSLMMQALGMIRQLGKPVWFLTLSAAEFLWTDAIRCIAFQYGKLYTDEEIEQMSRSEKHGWLRRNPVTAARQFDHRTKSLFSTFLKSDGKPLGQLTDFLYRIEFQVGIYISTSYVLKSCQN